MPRYGYYCDKCGKKFEIDCRMDERRKEVECPYCGNLGERTYDVPYVIEDIKPYYDRGLGCWVNSRTDKRAILASRGLVEVGNDNIGETEDLLGEEYAKKNRRPPKINK